MGANMAVEQGHCEHGRYSQCDGQCEGFIPMSERLWDDSAITPLGHTPAAPQTAGALFADLGVLGADDGTRLEALRCWLRDNTPSDRLVASLKRRGYYIIYIIGAR